MSAKRLPNTVHRPSSRSRASERFDLVLMDIQMPVMDGLTAMRKLQQIECAVPVVALTANAMKNDQESYRAAGFADFLAKPIEPEQLYRVLDKFLARAIAGKNEDDVPLFSRVQDDDAGIMRVVKNFVDKLPAYHADLTLAIQQHNWSAMRVIIHELKGLGGTMGYPVITEIATTMYFQSKSENLSGMQQLNARLRQLIERIQQGSTTSPDRLARAAAGPAA